MCRIIDTFFDAFDPWVDGETTARYHTYKSRMHHDRRSTRHLNKQVNVNEKYETLRRTHSMPPIERKKVDNKALKRSQSERRAKSVMSKETLRKEREQKWGMYKMAGLTEQERTYWRDQDKLFLVPWGNMKQRDMSKGNANKVIKRTRAEVARKGSSGATKYEKRYFDYQSKELAIMDAATSSDIHHTARLRIIERTRREIQHRILREMSYLYASTTSSRGIYGNKITRVRGVFILQLLRVTPWYAILPTA